MNHVMRRLLETARRHDGRLRTGRLRQALRRRYRDPHRDAGMSTAEYAVGTIAACAFAAVLYKVVTSGPVSEALQQLVEKALDGTV